MDGNGCFCIVFFDSSIRLKIQEEYIKIYYIRFLSYSMSASKDLYKIPYTSYTSESSTPSNDLAKTPSSPKESFTTYSSLNNQIDYIGDLTTKFKDIQGNVGRYNTAYDEVVKYKDFNDTTTNTDGTIWVDAVHGKPTLKDATKEDLHTMIVEQNKAHIIGMITLITVLVCTYLVVKK
jgi:hypothetical protein